MNVIKRLDADHVAIYREQILTIYREAFSPPPYRKSATEIDDFAYWLPQHFDRAGFRFMAAFSGDASEAEIMLGFAYGYDCDPGLWWRKQIEAQIPTERMADSFVFVEFAVAPRFQRQGIGGALHDHLLDGLPHKKALLSTLQAETAAYHLYRKRGWNVVLENFFFGGVNRPYQILGLDLANWTPGSSI